MTDKTLHFSTRLTRADVAGILEALSEGLKEGLLDVHKSDENLQLDVPRVIDLEVEASQKGDLAVMRFETSWRIKDSEIPEEPAPKKSSTKAKTGKEKKAVPTKKTIAKK